MARILIAEDDRDAGVLMQLVLRKAGHQVRLVGTGRAVLDACASETPDVLLLDVNMPEMDGYEAARNLKSDPEMQDIPIIFVTGSAEAHQRLEGFTVGAHDYITKPFHREELLARVDVAARIKLQADNLKAVNAQLAALSATDPLTGLCNRRSLGQRLEEEVSRANRYHAPLSCLMADVDHFKGINDRFGHQEGDRVLQMVSRVLRQSTRISDVVGRYGGEEFTVVAPAIDLIPAVSLAERIRTTIASQEITLGEEMVRITVSIGAATHVQGGTAQQLIAAADAALYAAKAGGRNRVAVPPAGDG